MKYEWTAEMSTGVEEIDAEHRTLIAWVNRLSEANTAGKGENEVAQILSFLGTYATRHFAHEEECFTKYQCPHAAANKKAHEDFVAHFTRVKADCDAKGVSPARAAELQQSLGSWLANHIVKVDTSLRPCVK